jgi:thiamine pyrophosphate-dependent acetolactate synthase large subunit-like protein
MTRNHQSLDRREVVAKLLQDRRDMLVVTGLGSPTYDVCAAGDNDANFYLWGAMGGAALVAYGIAKAQPDRPVVAITGDGEQLMGLGGLATIAVHKPANLSVVMLDNGHFGETGGQLSHSGHGVDIAAVATAIGFAHVETVTSDEQLDAVRQRIGSAREGPAFYRICISNAEAPRALPLRDGAAIVTRFRANLDLRPN